MLWRRGWWAWIVLGVGLVLLGLTRPVWMWTTVVAAGLAGGFAALANKRGKWDPQSGAWTVMVVAFVAACVFVPLVGRPVLPKENREVINMLREYGAADRQGARC